MMKNDAIVDAILILIKEYKSEVAKKHTSNRKAQLNSLKYLICQSIRQYDIPPNHHHVSKKALARWNKLTSEDIMSKHDRDKVDCDKLADVVRQYLLFTGANKEGIPVNISEEGFRFNDMFHEDHVIPVAKVFNEMEKAKKWNRKSLKSLLDGMHICILLKEEDRKLGKTKNRSLNWKQTIKNVYLPNKVTVVM